MIKKSLFDKNDKKLIGEGALIIGGFILAETLIRLFLNLAEKAEMVFWVLPVMAILLIIDGFQLKNEINEKVISSWIFDIFIFAEVVMIVLLKISNIGPYFFLWFSLVGMIVTAVSWFVEGYYKTKRKLAE